MAYEKQTWSDRQVEKPMTFTSTDNGDGTITLTPAPGTITEPGSLVTAERMNHIEDGIEQAASLTNVITNDNFAVIMGSITATTEEGAEDFTAHTNVNYPAGFSKDNCIVLAIGTNYDNNDSYTYSFGTLASADSPTALVRAAIGKSATLREDNIQLSIYFNYNASASASTHIYPYKLVLMKIIPDISGYELGDVNMNGSITQDDLTLVNNYLLHTGTLTDKQFKLADMNNDGIINSADTNAINKIILSGNS